MTMQQLELLQNVDIASVDKSNLVDLESIHIDANAPHLDRVNQFVRQVKNPYAFRVGDVAVKLEFTPNGKTLQESMISYLKTVRRK